MSTLFELTQKCHELINHLREKGLGISEVKGDYELQPNGYMFPTAEGSLIGYIAFTPTNINTLLIELNLGESAELTKLKKSVLPHVSEEYISVWERMWSYQVKTQAKALSDSWFGMCEESGKPIPSLWNSGEEGQVKVLKELAEILEGKLTALK